MVCRLDPETLSLPPTAEQDEEWEEFLAFLQKRFPDRFGPNAGEEEVVSWLGEKIRKLQRTPEYDEEGGK